LLQRRAYSYRPDGYVSRIEDLLLGSRTFALDPEGRVTAVTGQNWAERYAYDQFGNLTDATWPAPTPVPAGTWLDTDLQGPREAVGTLISRAGNLRYRHDQAGRVIQRTRVRLSRKAETWHYEWDASNRLAAVRTPDGSTWRYRYDPFGRRVAKQQLTPDGHISEETGFTWDGAVLAEQATTVTPQGPRRIVTWNYWPGSFTPLTQQEHTALLDAPPDEVDQRFHAIVTDLVGTPSELTNPDGEVAGRQLRTVWGGTTWSEGRAQTPLRFPGQYADPETGLHYNQQRYYDPVSGSYLTPDPLGLAPSANPHAYVSNPEVLTDPLGLKSCTRGSPPGLSKPAPEAGVTVYRGTSLTSELQIHTETGQLMSDAARAGYMESGGSVAAARTASEAAHAAGIETWGSEAFYAGAHGAFGTELSQIGPRSMISVTTDPAIAKIFAGPGGRVFSAVVDPSILIPQTLEGAGESEFFIPHMFGAG
jgi:RHS repeat-associated protein